MSRTVWISIIMGAAALLAGGAWWLFQSAYTYQGVVIDPPAPAADFTLTDQYGQPFRLGEQQGKAVLIYFGYTHCPDVCPITLSDFKQVKARLQRQGLDARVVFVFITADPQRDSPAVLREYLNNFDPTFVGLSGRPADLQKVYQAYGIQVEIDSGASAAGYLVSHTSRILLIDPLGRWRINYPFGMEADKIAADLAHLLRTEP